MADNTTASIILEQLGGKCFSMMTGAKNFVTNGNDLTFSLPGTGGFCKNGINRVNVELTPSYTYNVKFYRFRGGKATLISEHTDISDCDTLVELFKRETAFRNASGGGEMTAQPKQALAPTPEVFTCPDCGIVNRFESTEELQRCEHCGAFHKTNDLLADGVTL